jgi:hypothetical protein
MELDFREVALVAVRSVGRKDLDDAEQEASGEYRTPIAMGLGHKHLAPIACELTAWTGVLSVLARSLGRRLTGLGACSLLLRKARYGGCGSVRAQPRNPLGAFGSSHPANSATSTPARAPRLCAQRDKAVRGCGALSTARP